MKTTICHGHQTLSGRQFRHGDEIPPALLEGELLDYWLDKKLATEVDDTERRSLYKLFAPFSGTAQPERLELDAELAQHTLP